MKPSLKVARALLALAVLILALFVVDGTVSWAQSYLGPGDRAVVFGVGSAGLSVREGPGYRFPVITVLPQDAQLDVVNGPSWSSSLPWFLVAGFDGNRQGWVAGNYLQPVEPDENSGTSGDGDSRANPDARGGQPAGGKSFIAIVTGYSIHGRTSSGKTTEWGVIAVDPNVIPMGSKVQIDGFDEPFVAADTGGGVRGNWIDIWFANYADAAAFGTQSRRVTVITP